MSNSPTPWRHDKKAFRLRDKNGNDLTADDADFALSIVNALAGIITADYTADMFVADVRYINKISRTDDWNDFFEEHILALDRINSALARKEAAGE